MTLWRNGIPDQVRRLAGRSERGLTDKEVAEHVGVDVRTVHRWKQAHPEFAQALIETKAIMDARVELSLYRRALGYRYTEVEVTIEPWGENGKLVETKRVEREKEILPDVAACKHWLSCRDPEHWTERRVVEASVAVSPVPLDPDLQREIGDLIARRRSAPPEELP